MLGFERATSPTFILQPTRSAALRGRLQPLIRHVAPRDGRHSHQVDNRWECLRNADRIRLQGLLGASVSFTTLSKYFTKSGEGRASCRSGVPFSRAAPIDRGVVFADAAFNIAPIVSTCRGVGRNCGVGGTFATALSRNHRQEAFADQQRHDRARLRPQRQSRLCLCRYGLWRSWQGSIPVVQSDNAS